MVVHHVFNLPRPVYDNALQVLHKILDIEIGWRSDVKEYSFLFVFDEHKLGLPQLSRGRVGQQKSRIQFVNELGAKAYVPIHHGPRSTLYVHYECPCEGLALSLAATDTSPISIISAGKYMTVLPFAFIR